MIVPGTDGQKMSKSYNNVIDIFLPENDLRKQIMSIKTDSTGMEDSKDADSCNVFKLYSLLGSEEQITNLKEKYLAGNFGYGHAKQALFELICEKFKVEREKYNEYMNDKKLIDIELAKGAKKAKNIAQKVLKDVRQKIGY